MQASVFFPKLRDYLLTKFTTLTKEIKIVTGFPVEQLERLTSPTILIIDEGKAPFSFNPNVTFVNFSVAIFTDYFRDPFGDATINKLQTNEHTVHDELLSIKTLNSEKVIIQFIKTSEISFIRNNNPLAMRVWTYQTILEV